MQRIDDTDTIAFKQVGSIAAAAYRHGGLKVVVGGYGRHAAQKRNGIASTKKRGQLAEGFTAERECALDVARYSMARTAGGYRHPLELAFGEYRINRLSHSFNGPTGDYCKGYDLSDINTHHAPVR